MVRMGLSQPHKGEAMWTSGVMIKWENPRDLGLLFLQVQGVACGMD